MLILGISAYYHDSAAAVVKDGEIIAAAQEERFTRKKHDASFPENAVRFCLDFSGYSIEDFDAIAFYDKPFLKFERILETYYVNSPKGLPSFLKSMPVWVKEKLFLRKLIRDELVKISGKKRPKLKLLFPEHHLSHAASAFFTSPHKESGILTIDGVGEWATCTISVGRENTIEILRELTFPDSVGLLYSAFTYYLGFRVNSGEYKLMGLAPYGNPGSERTSGYISLIKKELVNIKSDGSIKLNQVYFKYSTGLKMTHNKRWKELFGFERRKPESDIEQHHCDLAFAIQTVTEEIVLALASETKKITASNNLCLAGGVALNCVANGKVLKNKIFDQIYIQPASGDAGGAIGAALAAEYIYYQSPREIVLPDSMKNASLGPSFNNSEIGIFLNRVKADYEYLEEEELYNRTSEFISKGNVVGWFQGRMEFGPRALGNRSILGDATNPEMQKRMNLKIKFRESFRPFAPVVLADDVSSYFEVETTSPYMLLVGDVRAEKRIATPPGYLELDYMDRLSIPRSEIQSVTHVDFSARIQTVTEEGNKQFYNLLLAYKNLTGCSVLINTSFNVRGEPIVNSPEEAFRCFMNTGMDVLVLGNYICTKNASQEDVNSDYLKQYLKKD